MEELLQPHYDSDETIRAGDRVQFAGRPGVIKFVLGHGSQPPQADWFVRQHGNGFMLWTAETGPIFHEEADEDLILVSRAESVPDGSW